MKLTRKFKQCVRYVRAVFAPVHRSGRSKRDEVHAQLRAYVIEQQLVRAVREAVEGGKR